MYSIADKCKILLTLLGDIFNWLFGGFDLLIYALIGLVILDYISEVLLAVHNKEVSGEMCFKYFCRKIMLFILVAVGNIFDKNVIGTGNSLRTLIIIFYLSNEGISIIENASEIGLPIPQKLKDSLQKLHSNNADKNQ